MSILTILEELAATKSKNDKLAILQREKDNELLQQVFKAAYDPTINYYIKKIPSYVHKQTSMFSLGIVLDDLGPINNREITGNDAIDYLTKLFNVLSYDDAQVLERIIKRDLKCGATEGTANKVWKGLIPEFPYMRCALSKDAKFSKWNWKAGVYSQLKADGMFANIDHNLDGTIEISSRAGSQFDASKFKKVCAEIAKFDRNVRLNGEFLVKRDDVILSREVGNGIMNSVLKGGDFAENEEPMFLAWDILPLDQAVPGGRIKTPYKERFARLCTFVSPDVVDAPVGIIPTVTVYSLEAAYDHYFSVIKLGLEGTIIKNPEAEWFDGTSKEQIKLKVKFECDLEITGFNEGNGRNEETFGSIATKTSDGLLEVDIPGRGDKMREFFHANRDTMIGRIITVEANNITKDERTGKWSLFLPVFLELREDKFEADTYSRVREQYEAVINPK